jgi:hypothetical protein
LGAEGGCGEQEETDGQDSAAHLGTAGECAGGGNPGSKLISGAYMGPGITRKVRREPRVLTGPSLADR